MNFQSKPKRALSLLILPLTTLLFKLLTSGAMLLPPHQLVLLVLRELKNQLLLPLQKLPKHWLKKLEKICHLTLKFA